MKKIFSILFLFIFVYNLIGYYTVFIVLQNHVRDEIKHRIKKSVPDDQLVLISISLADNQNLTWTKPNKEFRYKGEMYDIVNQETKEDMIVYYCIHDFKESKLYADLNKHIQKHITNNPKQKKKNEKLFKKFTKKYFFKAFPITYSDELLHDLRYKKYLRTYHSICLDISTPPPQLV